MRIPIYLVVYNHRDDIVFDFAARNKDYSERIRLLMLTYSATDVLRGVLFSTHMNYFESIVSYNNMSLSILLLSNGFKIMAILSGEILHAQPLPRDLERPFSPIGILREWDGDVEGLLRRAAKEVVGVIMDPVFDEECSERKPFERIVEALELN